MSPVSSPMQNALLLHGASLYTHIIVTAVICAVFLVLFFLINKRFVKIMCACGIEVFVWLLVRALWGKDSIAAQILCYVTAAAVIVLTLAIVNRIDWSNMGPKKYK